MTAIRLLAGILCLTALISARAVSTQADGLPAKNEKICSGTITAVDAKENVIKVQRFLFNKTLVLSDKCVLTLGDKLVPSLAAFKVGQEVNISYIDASGVLVADRIAQQELHFSGRVQALDRNAHTLTVRHWGASKSFTIPEDCNVILDDDVRGALNDVKLGNRVTVIFEAPCNHVTAHQIELLSG